MARLRRTVARRPGPQARRRALRGGLIGLGVGLAVAASTFTPPAESYERRALDIRTRLLADPRRADPRIVAIVIDQRSLDRIAAPAARGGLDHGWPWPRDYYAAVIEYVIASGARAVGVDLNFTEPSLHTRLGVAEDDAELARTYRGRPVVQGAMLTAEPPGAADREWRGALNTDPRFRLVATPPTHNKASLPVDDLLRAAGGIGWIGFEPDVDGVCRSVRAAAVYAPQGEPRGVEVLAMPLALARAAGATVEVAPGRLVVDGRRIPLDEDGRLLLRFHGGERYAGPAGPVDVYRQFSFAKVLESAKRRQAGQPTEAAHPGDFAGKIVLIGATAAGLLDLRATSVDATLPGFLVHATALDNLLHGDPLRRAPLAVRLAVIVAMGGLTGAVVTTLASFRLGMLAVLAGLGGYLALVLWGFRGPGLWLDFVPPGLALGLATVGANGYLYVTEGRQRKFLRDAFSRYLSPAIVQKLVTDPARLALGGDSRDLTVMFVDVAGFTTLSEGRAPGELVSLMNEYFTELTEVIQAHGGTVDKFIGDAVMAFWNAPLEQPDHAARAARAARDVLGAMARLNQRWGQRGLPRIGARVGLATGPALVGNVGSRSKFNYTAMGDTVNLASRLEGAAKVYGTSSLVAGSTVEAATGVAFRELDWLQVKGRTAPVPVYAIVPADEADDPTFAQVRACYAAGLQAYRDRRFDEALRNLDKALATVPEDGPAQELATRCREFLEAPPPPAWRGAHAMHTK